MMYDDCMGSQHSDLMQYEKMLEDQRREHEEKQAEEELLKLKLMHMDDNLKILPEGDPNIIPEEIGKGENRAITTDLHNILDLLNCAETYGFADDVFVLSMFEMTGPVTDEEIVVFADKFIVPHVQSSDYDGAEDRENAIETLTRLRDQYGQGFK